MRAMMGKCEDAAGGAVWKPFRRSINKKYMLSKMFVHCIHGRVLATQDIVYGKENLIQRGLIL